MSVERRREVPPRRFLLERSNDISGVSGTGIVAYGCHFNDDTAVLRWNTVLASTAVYSHIDELIAIHGHPDEHGVPSTRIVYLDSGYERGTCQKI